MEFVRVLVRRLGGSLLEQRVIHGSHRLLIGLVYRDRAHLVALSISARKWPISISLATQYLTRLEKWALLRWDLPQPDAKTFVLIAPRVTPSAAKWSFSGNTAYIVTDYGHRDLVFKILSSLYMRRCFNNKDGYKLYFCTYYERLREVLTN